MKKTISTYDMTWPQVVDLEGRYQSTFNVYSYPTYILVDPNGKIVATNEELKSGKLYQTITKYLSQEP